MAPGNLYLSFELNGNLFGIDVLLVREVIHDFEATPVETATDIVRGLINLRGQLVTLLDLGPRIGGGERAPGAAAHCVILKTSTELAAAGRSEFAAGMPEETVGLVVDGIGDVVAPAAESVGPAPANLAGVNEEYVAAVALLEGKLMMLMDVSRALAPE
ncbi:MAG: chemotaxis protein CheW [Nitrospinae bacterium]|nr:chemotaxis protein CheW [Nitrospinota bacterium]